MQCCKSVMAEMLRERRLLLEKLHFSHKNREELLHRLQQVNELIAAEERRGPRVYLDHIITCDEQQGEDRG